MGEKYKFVPEPPEVEAAVAVYKNGWKYTAEQLKALGFIMTPGKDYLKEKVYEVLAEAYIGRIT